MKHCSISAAKKIHDERKARARHALAQDDARLQCLLEIAVHANARDGLNPRAQFGLHLVVILCILLGLELGVQTVDGQVRHG
jgi:hypothetical protein